MNRLSQNPDTATKTKKTTFLSSNPVMRRLNSVDEVAEDNAATYGGIILKTAYFLLFSIAGIVLQLVLSAQLSTGQLLEFSIYKLPVSMYMGEMIAMLAAVVLGIVFQLLAFFAKATTPVTGALYCVTQGYFISFLIFKVLAGYEYLGLLALAITMLIILVMAILYATGVIRVTKKFKMVMLTLFITSIAASLLMLLGSLLGNLLHITFIQNIMTALGNNLALSIGFSVLFILIAALFLICDFATIEHVVKDKLPKKYEWMAAFGLAFTVLWLYLKVLELILKIMGSKKN